MLITQAAIMNAVANNPHGHVYSGRGECYKKLNIPFRLKIQRDSPRYVATTNNEIKHQIALQLYQEIQRGGGLFFDETGKEMSEKVALKKIKKALKDAKKQTVRTARKKEQKVTPKSEFTLPVSNENVRLTESDGDYLLTCVSDSSDVDAVTSSLSSEVPQEGSSLPSESHDDEGSMEYHPEISEPTLQTPVVSSDEGACEEIRGCLLQGVQNFVIEDDAYMERLLHKPIADFEVDSISWLDEVNVEMERDCLDHQERPEDGTWSDSLSAQYRGEENVESFRTKEVNSQEAIVNEVPMEDVGTENADMSAFFRDLDLEEFDDTSVGLIIDAIQQDEFAW